MGQIGNGIKARVGEETGTGPATMREDVSVKGQKGEKTDTNLLTTH